MDRFMVIALRQDRQPPEFHNPCVEYVKPRDLMTFERQNVVWM
jgi:hypothetical protein